MLLPLQVSSLQADYSFVVNNFLEIETSTVDLNDGKSSRYIAPKAKICIVVRKSDQFDEIMAREEQEAAEAAEEAELAPPVS